LPTNIIAKAPIQSVRLFIEDLLAPSMSGRFGSIKTLCDGVANNIVFFMEFNSRYTLPVDYGAREHVKSANPYNFRSGVCRWRPMQQGREVSGARNSIARETVST
jgi:hypothetical protein